MTQFILSDLTLLIPSKNDSANIRGNFKDIENYLSSKIMNYEIIIISNNSNVQEIKTINQVIHNKKYTKHIVYDKGGKGFAIREGVLNAKYNNILFSDADFSVSIDEFDKFVKNNSLLADLVIGSRKIKGSLNLNSPIKRKITGILFMLLTNFLFKINIKDTQCGFKALKKDSYNEFMYNEDGFVFDIELILLTKLNNLSISEVPVKYVHQKNSSVKVYRDSIKMFFGLLRLYKNFYKII